MLATRILIITLDIRSKLVGIQKYVYSHTPYLKEYNEIYSLKTTSMFLKYELSHVQKKLPEVTFNDFFSIVINITSVVCKGLKH